MHFSGTSEALAAYTHTHTRARVVPFSVGVLDHTEVKLWTGGDAADVIGSAGCR